MHKHTHTCEKPTVKTLVSPEERLGNLRKDRSEPRAQDGRKLDLRELTRKFFLMVVYLLVAGVETNVFKWLIQKEGEERKKEGGGGGEEKGRKLGGRRRKRDSVIIYRCK